MNVTNAKTVALAGALGLVAVTAGLWIALGDIGLIVGVGVAVLVGTAAIALLVIRATRSLRHALAAERAASEEAVARLLNPRADEVLDKVRRTREELGQLRQLIHDLGDEVAQLRATVTRPGEHGEALLRAIHTGFVRVEASQDELVASITDRLRTDGDVPPSSADRRGTSGASPGP